MHLIIVLLFLQTELLQFNMISQLNNNMHLYIFFKTFLAVYEHHRYFQHISEQTPSP